MTWPNENTKNELDKRLEAHPQIKERFNRLLDLMENRCGTLIRADDIEMALIPEVRGLGRELLEIWAKKQEESNKEQGEAEGLTH
jgi:hypothetical protein